MKTGVVLKSTGSNYLVKSDNQIYDCRAKGNFKIKDIKSTNPVVVGDWVDIENMGDLSYIVKIHDRKNYIVRRSTNLSKQKHIIAANIDQAFLIVTIVLPETALEFIDRFLATAEAYRIPAKIIFNKIDLYSDGVMDYLEFVKSIYEKIGYECITTSATKNIRIDELRTLLKEKVTLISGNSGVGKSTLINTIDPTLSLRVNKISDYHLKGKHTTTFTEMFEITSGGYVIDTPGIKGFGVVDFQKNEIYHFFREIFKIAEGCQFYNCLHSTEPKCAVKKAVEEGKISESRYISYLSLLHEDEGKYR